MSIQEAQQYLDGARTSYSAYGGPDAMRATLDAIGCLIGYIEDLQTELTDLRAQVAAEAKTDPTASPAPLPEPGTVDLSKLDLRAFDPKMSSGWRCYYCGVYHSMTCPLSP